MKYELPENHGMSDRIVDSLVFKVEDTPSLTDVQFAALDAGLGHGNSLLVVSPTSTGKTQIGVWAIAKGIETGSNAVYLVTHRALAKQKHDEFKRHFVEFLDGDLSGIVLATGDGVVDGNGDRPADPLESVLLIATYEKYLAMLSATGVPSSMANTVVICDEIQLLGDASRGRNVEVLLTLLRNAVWKQFVGLSAVLRGIDGEELSDWLNVALVIDGKREKELVFEYWGSSGIELVTTALPSETEQNPLPSGVRAETLGVVRHISSQDSDSLPIIVFCMRKQDVYDLATAEYANRVEQDGSKQSTEFGDLPSTAAIDFLAKALPHRIAIHCADLTDDERQIVESRLAAGDIDVVFATSTLSAGVHFPLGAAVFHKWKRWDSEQRTHLTIDPAEFHNMAGRVGRMGTSHISGRVLFFPDAGHPPATYRRYLDMDDMPEIKGRIAPDVFEQLSLQLISSNLCQTYEGLEELVSSSFSGQRTKAKNAESFADWPEGLRTALDILIATGMVVEMVDGSLLPTPVGKSVASSGLRPVTAGVLIDYFAKRGQALADLITYPVQPESLEKFAFLVFAAAFASPAFCSHRGIQPSRFLPWPLKDLTYDASSYAEDLLEPNWFVERIATNSANAVVEWINGKKLSELEAFHSSLRAGMLLEMHRNLNWVLQGVVSLLTTATDPRTPEPLRPVSLRGQPALLAAIRKLPRTIGRLRSRVQAGLPDDVLWMVSLNQSAEPYTLSREEMIDLRARRFLSPELLSLGSADADSARCEVFLGAKPAPQVKANWLRDRCRSWKSAQRERTANRHGEMAKKCGEPEIVTEYYTSRGIPFENVFERILAMLGVEFEKLDDGSKTGAPDYLVNLRNSPSLVIELKSREGEGLVGYNLATEVLAASELHGHKDKFCVTLCHPGVDPAVALEVIGCGRLSVVESCDLGDALLRLCQGYLSQEQLWSWLATPGQALASDLPFSN